METKPITRIIVWTGGRWVDQETGVYAANLKPPAFESEEHHHPFDQSFTLTYEQVVKLIDQTLAMRTTGVTTMNYFQPAADMLVSYATVCEMNDRLSRDVWALKIEVARLSRPWYKRWFS